MVLNVKPTAERLVTAIRWPCRHISEPNVQLLNKHLLAQLFQDFASVVFRVTFWDQIDRGLSPNFVQGDSTAKLRAQDPMAGLRLVLRMARDGFQFPTLQKVLYHVWGSASGRIPDQMYLRSLFL